MVNVKGLDFKTSYEKSIVFEDDDLFIRTIQKDDLIKAKQHAARPKDMDDLQNIQ